MKVTPIKTGRVEACSSALTDILESSLEYLPENSVVAITSKIVSLCEGNIVRPEEAGKEDIIKKEADLYLPGAGNKYGVFLTVKNSIFIANAGVDESNTGGYYVLWPEDPQASAARCWNFLKERYGVRNIGVIITDSVTTPLKWGVTGSSIGYCGFDAVNSRVGTKDLFGRELRFTRVNVANALAAAAVLCMGEADEQTPVALIEDLPFVNFKTEPPSAEELKAEKIAMEDDLYGQILGSVRWQKGGKA